MRVMADGRVELRTSSNAAEFLVGQSSTGTVLQTGGIVKSDNLVRIGSNADGIGQYTISAGALTTASDGSGTFQIAHNGASGTLRVEGTGSFTHGAELFIGSEPNQNSTARLEIVGSNANVQIGQLDNTSGGTSETIQWIADANGISPLKVTGAGPLAASRVQLQDPAEAAANTGGGMSILGDGIALALDLSAITISTSLLLVDNQTTDAITGLFEKALTTTLYSEGEQIPDTGFNGTVTISYVGGTGNDVTLNLAAAGLPGDHNSDGLVDAADYVAWRKTGTGASQGYDDWRQNFGATAPGEGGFSNVPEPASWLVILIGLVSLRVGRLSNRRKYSPVICES
jgi:hypothetical protein